MTSRLKLYGSAFHNSPYVFSCFVALREKGVDFEMVTLKLHEKEQGEEWYRDLSLTGRVPTLEDGDFRVSESSAIVEYIDETQPGPKMLPASPRERARARQIMAWIRSDLMPIREERSSELLFYPEQKKPPLSPEGRAAAERLLRLAQAVVPPAGSSLFGSFSIVDADLAFMLHRLILNGDPVPARPREYAEAVWQRAPIQEWMNLPRPPYVPY